MSNKVSARISKVPSLSFYLCLWFLPAAIPVLAGLSTLGSIVGEVNGITKAIADFKSASVQNYQQLYQQEEVYIHSKN